MVKMLSVHHLFLLINNTYHYRFKPCPSCSHSLWLYLLEVENLKHESPNVWLPINSVREAMDGLLNRGCSWISESPVVLIRVLDLIAVDDESVKILLPQELAAELVHQKTTVLLLQPFPRSIDVLHKQPLGHHKILPEKSC